MGYSFFSSGRLFECFCLFLPTMEELIQYIEQLLRTNDCVIVPQWGAFITTSCEATIQKEQHLFLPPRKLIAFNTSIKHDDGLIVSLWVQKHQVSEGEARWQIQLAVDDMKRELKSKRELLLGKVGRMYINERSELQFECLADENFFPDYFGLQSFRCLEWRYLEEEPSYTRKESHKQEYIHIRIRRYHVQQFMVACIAAFLLLLVSKPVETPVKDYASLLTTVATPIVSADPVVSVLEVKEEQNIVLSEVENEPVVAEEPVIVAEPLVPATSIEKPIKKEIKKNQRTYYIVVGSVTSSEEAVEIIAEQKSKGYSETSSIAGNGRIRIYVKTFTDRTQAEAYLDAYRVANPQNADAWLLSLRK